MSAVVNCPPCAFFARVTREKCFCWQAFRNRRRLCIISCFFKQCEKQCENFHRGVFSPSCSQCIIAWNSWAGVPRRNGATCQEVTCWSCLWVHQQHTLSTVWALPASTFFTGTLLTKLEKEIRLPETQIVRGIIMPKVIYFIQ